MGRCAVCEKECKSSCSNCSRYNVSTFYCSVEHQRQHWKGGHKKTCGAAKANQSSGTGSCSRCLKRCDSSSKCRVEHPMHLRSQMGGQTYRGPPAGMRWDYHCSACGQTFATMEDHGSGVERIVGVRWCFQGKHSSAILHQSDERRVHPNLVALKGDASTLQAKIDAVPKDVRKLLINAEYSEDLQLVLEHEFKQLRELHLDGVPFKKVTLNKELTPRLKKLVVSNMPDPCNFTVHLPSLRTVSLQYWSGDESTVREMLEHATKLQAFDSYKLWSNGELSFRSKKLLIVDLHRADCLQSISIDAPHLQQLRVQGCYGLEDIVFVSEQAKGVTLQVNALNANLGHGALQSLKKRGAVVSTAGRAANPAEAMWARNSF